MTLYREIAEGKLPAIRIRDRVLVPKVVLERLVEEAISRAIGTGSPTSGWCRCGMTPGLPCRLGGHRPPDAPPFTSPGDQLLALGLGAAAGAGALVWATGQAAGLAFGHTWLELSPADVAHILWHLPQHWNDPALAWPDRVRGRCLARPACTPPSPAWSAASPAGPPAVLRHLPGRAAGHRPGHPRSAKHAAAWAGGRELRLLTVREPQAGRVISGRTPGVFGRLLAAEDCHSVPGVRAHRQLQDLGPGHPRGPRMVRPAGRHLGQAGPAAGHHGPPRPPGPGAGHRPLGASGVQAARWSPLASCSTWAGAQQMAVMLANAIEQTPTEEQRPEHRFWKTMGTKFLAPMLYAAATKGLGMAEVLHWLDSREDQEVKDILAAAGVPAAWTPGSPASTAPTGPWTRCTPRPRRSCTSTPTNGSAPRPTATTWTWTTSCRGQHDLPVRPRPPAAAPAAAVRDDHPAGGGRRPGAGRLAPDGMLSPRLGLFLDEAATAPPCRTSTCWPPPARGQGIQLVTVWHDKSQLEARYGPKASTILNNHRAKLFLSGLADLSALELGARLIGDQALVDRNRSMGSDGRPP